MHRHLGREYLTLSIKYPRIQTPAPRRLAQSGRSAAMADQPRTQAPEPTLELVLKRNSIERLKREKFPFALMDELPDLIERGYEAISEEDIVRFQWYGLYHDKPKVGTFMMRVKVPSGMLTTHQLRTMGELSLRFGRGDGELSTRQNIQMHWIRLEHLPDIFSTLEAAGLTTLGACGDCVRNITGCPVAGIDPDEAFDATPLVRE